MIKNESLLVCSNHGNSDWGQSSQTVETIDFSLLKTSSTSVVDRFAQQALICYQLAFEILDCVVFGCLTRVLHCFLVVSYMY